MVEPDSGQMGALTRSSKESSEMLQLAGQRQRDEDKESREIRTEKAEGGGEEEQEERLLVPGVRKIITEQDYLDGERGDPGCINKGMAVNGQMMKTIRKDEPADCSVKGGRCGREESRGREEGLNPSGVADGKEAKKEGNLKIRPLVSWQSKRGIGLTVNGIIAQITTIIFWRSSKTEQDIDPLDLLALFPEYSQLCQYRNYLVVLCLISSHEAGRCPSLSYDSAEETSSSDAFPVNLMVIRPGARHWLQWERTRPAVPHVLDAGASHGARTWRAFASTLTYSTAPASLSLHFCPPGPLLRAGRDCVRSATTLARSAHAPASRCTRPKSHFHLLGGHWMMSFGAGKMPGTRCIQFKLKQSYVRRNRRPT
eukprot:bmy_17167T0